MYIKSGKLCKETNSGNLIIQNSNGQAYEVNYYITAFVWERLDGATPLPVIKKEIAKVGDTASEDLGKCVEVILVELEKVGLARQRDYEISY